MKYYGDNISRYKSIHHDTFLCNNIRRNMLLIPLLHTLIIHITFNGSRKYSVHGRPITSLFDIVLIDLCG